MPDPRVREAALWGVLAGAIQGASPLAFWWLEPVGVYALGLVFIAAIYIGFAVADGRPKVLMVESGVAALFVLVAALGITGSGWLLVIGYVGHGVKDLWQHRSHFVARTRWWPPFCLVVDFTLAVIMVVLLVAGSTFSRSRPCPVPRREKGSRMAPLGALALRASQRTCGWRPGATQSLHSRHAGEGRLLVVARPTVAVSRRQGPCSVRSRR
jgi:hypothetical protein